MPQFVEIAPFVGSVSFCIIILAVLVYKLNKNDNKRFKIKNTVKILGVIAVLLYVIALSLVMIANIIELFWYSPVYRIAFILWALANCCTYFSLIERIKLTFENTTYNSSKHVYKFLYILSIIYLILP